LANNAAEIKNKALKTVAANVTP